jgi:hypothetical protein
MQVSIIDPLIPAPMGAPRTEGVHLSRLIRNMAVEYGLLDKEWVQDLGLVEVQGNGQAWWDSLDEVSKIRMSLGLAWEQYYLPLLPGMVHQPGEMSCEGIYMNQDGESLDVIMVERKPTHMLAIHEVKVTYKSTKTVADIAKQWLWLMQVKGYCWAKGTRLAYLHVLFLCGDYGYPIQPQKRIWRILFEQTEIDEAWELVTNYRNHRLKQEAEDAMKDTR